MKIKKFHLHFNLFILTTWVDIFHHIVLSYYNSSVTVLLRFKYNDVIKISFYTILHMHRLKIIHIK